MVYSSSGVVDNKDSNNGEYERGGGIGGSNWCSESADPVLDLLSDLYSESDIFLYMY